MAKPPRSRVPRLFAHALCSKIAAHDTFHNEIRTMKQAPNYKCPSCAVPEAAQKHDDDQIGRGAVRTDLIAAERNIKVIAQRMWKARYASAARNRKTQ